MWDNAPLLRGIATVLYAFCLLALLYGAGYYLLHLPGTFPLRSVRMSAAPQHAEADQVMVVLRKELQGNLVTVDIDRLRRSLEQLAWVRKVSVRREFPDGLVVQLEEHQALARWNNTALVNQQGEVFIAGSVQELPVFVGPEGTSAEVAQHYAEFNRQLAVLDLHAARMTLSPRHAWEIHLSNGMLLKLGREDMQQRLAKFVTVYPYSLEAMQSKVKYVDLRYRNGFAVSGLTKQG